MRILLITADEATAEAIGRGLEGRGHTIDPAPTSATGLAWASLHAYDAIVVDPAVPGRDALDTAAALGGRGGRVPVLALSPLVGRDGASLGFGAGRDEAPRALALDDLVARLDLLRREGAEPVPARDSSIGEGVQERPGKASPSVAARRSSRRRAPC